MEHARTAQVIMTDLHFTGSGAETLCLWACFLVVRHGFLKAICFLFADVQ